MMTTECVKNWIPYKMTKVFPDFVLLLNEIW